MREILFRGKEFSGNWVYGSFLEGCMDDAVFIVKINKEKMLKHTIAVIPEIVGQYTGLTDKNGKKIFEGDIVKCTDTFSDYEFMAVVMFGNPKGEYSWGFQLNRISGANANTDILLWVDMEETGAFIEVIGNIHDNPELLKGGNNEQIPTL
jgi:uncharacterized phage protein (TIGR01671 family)